MSNAGNFIAQNQSQVHQAPTEDELDAMWRQLKAAELDEIDRRYIRLMQRALSLEGGAE